MKLTRFLGLALIAAGIGGGLTACSDKDDTPDNSIVIKDENGNISLTIKNPEKWAAIAKKAAAELRDDAAEQLSDWITEESIKLKTQAPSRSISEIIDECAEEANEIATENIPSPLAIFTTGDDCLANIASIRNVLLGSLDGSVNESSIMAVTALENSALAQKLSSQLSDATMKIQAIPKPLRQNAGSTEAKAASAACLTLERTLRNELKPLFRTMTGKEAEQRAIVTQYADEVVTPSVTAAQTAADELLVTVNALHTSPTEAQIKAAIAAYVKARGALDLCAAFID